MRWLSGNYSFAAEGVILFVCTPPHPRGPWGKQPYRETNSSGGHTLAPHQPPILVFVVTSFVAVSPTRQFYNQVDISLCSLQCIGGDYIQWQNLDIQCLWNLPQSQILLTFETFDQRWVVWRQQCSKMYEGRV